MPIIKKKFITRQFMREHPDWYFVFGDNMSRVGMGGQAKEMRGEPNAVGIVTKAKPTYEYSAFLRDNNSEHHDAVKNDLEKLFSLLKDDKIVVIPEDGIGTGLARLEETAPILFSILQTALKEAEQYYGVSNI